MKNARMNRVLGAIRAPFESFSRQRKLKQERNQMKQAKSRVKEEHQQSKTGGRGRGYRRFRLSRYFGASDVGKKPADKRTAQGKAVARYCKRKHVCKTTIQYRRGRIATVAERICNRDWMLKLEAVK